MNYLNYSASVGSNYFSNYQRYNLSYLVEDSDWVIKRVGENLVNKLKEIEPNFKTRISLSPFFLKDQIIHYGSENIFFGKHKCYLPSSSCKIILTWFHFVENDKRLKLLLENQDKIAFLHTACSEMKNRFVKAGFDKKKIIVIPLGVDLLKFKNYKEDDRNFFRKKYHIPTKRLVIGSFQKDGDGWRDGNNPKMIKGPDILVDTLIKLKKYNLHVLLSGPARGYIVQKLKQNKIEYVHVFLKDYLKMPELYQCLDMYLITSREEGGPIALLEAMACGVPVVSTRVGMSNDLIKDGINGFFADFNPESIATKTIKLIDDTSLREKIIKNSEKTIMDFDEKKIAKRYFDELYSK